MTSQEDFDSYSASLDQPSGLASNSAPSGASQAQPRSKVGNMVKSFFKAYAMGGLGGGDASAAGAGVPTGEGGGGGTTSMGASNAPKSGQLGGPGGGITGLGPGASDSGLLGYGGNKRGGPAKGAEQTGLPYWMSNFLKQQQGGQVAAGYAPSKPASATMDWVQSYLANRPDIQGP